MLTQVYWTNWGAVKSSGGVFETTPPVAVTTGGATSDNQNTYSSEPAALPIESPVTFRPIFTLLSFTSVLSVFFTSSTIDLNSGLDCAMRGRKTRILSRTSFTVPPK